MDLNVLIRFYQLAEKDQRIRPNHISMYTGLFYLWTLSELKTPYHISRRQLMKISKIKSYATYHKCIKELVDFGFITYSPSYHPGKGSLLSLLSDLT
jgi:hypothetical protein